MPICINEYKYADKFAHSSITADTRKRFVTISSPRDRPPHQEIGNAQHGDLVDQREPESLVEAHVGWTIGLEVAGLAGEIGSRRSSAPSGRRPTPRPCASGETPIGPRCTCGLTRIVGGPGREPRAELSPQTRCRRRQSSPASPGASPFWTAGTAASAPSGRVTNESSIRPWRRTSGLSSSRVRRERRRRSCRRVKVRTRRCGADW